MFPYMKLVLEMVLLGLNRGHNNAYPFVLTPFSPFYSHHIFESEVLKSYHKTSLDSLLKVQKSLCHSHSPLIALIVLIIIEITLKLNLMLHSVSC